MLAGSESEPDTDARRLARELCDRGYVVLAERYDRPAQAWTAAERVILSAADEDTLCQQLPPLQVLANYTMPPPGAAQRAFQVLHVDFGVPLGLAARADVARYTVLYLDAAAAGSGAATRIVALADLAKQRRWPGVHDLAERLRVRPDDPDVAEGVLARIVEAADQSAQLPSKTGDLFLCGLEFDTIEAERSYLAGHGLDLSTAERRVALQPGQCLIFDNLQCAHGRLGIRATEELHQRCLGFASLSPTDQQVVLGHTLACLTRSDQIGAVTSTPSTLLPSPAGE